KVEARSVQTLEGLLDRPVWRAVTDAFAQIRAFQCGFCTPGMVVVAGALLRDNPAPTRDEIVAALDGNICRCGTYPRIVRVVERAARSLAKEPVGPADWAANPTATVLPLTTDDPRFQ